MEQYERLLRCVAHYHMLFERWRHRELLCDMDAITVAALNDEIFWIAKPERGDLAGVARKRRREEELLTGRLLLIVEICSDGRIP